MPADALLTRAGPATWTNFHGTVTVPVRANWTIRNPAGKPTMAGLRATAARLQGLIGEAVAQGMRLRAVGSRWSFSEVASADDGWALSTDLLNWDFAVAPELMDPATRLTAEELVFVQCGVSIAAINRKIETPERGRSLRTSGASNGQTIAGALGTGVHGSAIDVGALESQVAGLQLLTATRNLWLEPPAGPAMGAAFATKLGAELVRDAALFEAALVSLGMLGVVHSVLLRTTGRYRLRSGLRRLPAADVARAMNTLDFTGVALPDPTRRPYFFQAVIDPAKPERAYVTTRYKEPCPPDYVVDGAQRSGYEPGNDLPGLLGQLLGVAPALLPLVKTVLIESQLSPFENKVGTPGETFSYTNSKPGTAGCALAVPVAQVTRALDIARAAYESVPGSPVAFACRYMQKSPALLAFTRFDPTCVIDIDGLDTAPVRRTMEAVRAAFDAAGMPYAQHWGKLHGLTRARVRAGFGSAIDRWTAVRHRLLPDPAERATFSTPLFDGIGLND